MKYSNLIFIVLFFINTEVFSESFTLNGKVIESIVSEKIIDCGKYKILLKKENFPFKYEMEIPKHYQIKGFYGSAVYIDKSAFIMPSNSDIPRPNEIAELKELYPDDRTYLPGSAVCRGNTLIVSYWSGGNCKNCEAFVQFDISNGNLRNARQVSYKDVKLLNK